MPPDEPTELERDAVRLRHMLQCSLYVRMFVEGRTETDVRHDPQLAFALVKAMEVIGEAAGKMSGAGQVRIPGVPWRDMREMRNRTVHGYDSIDYGIVWKTATEDVPVLITALQAALSAWPKV